MYLPFPYFLVADIALRRLFRCMRMRMRMHTPQNAAARDSFPLFDFEREKPMGYSI